MHDPRARAEAIHSLCWLDSQDHHGTDLLLGLKPSGRPFPSFISLFDLYRN